MTYRTITCPDCRARGFITGLSAAGVARPEDVDWTVAWGEPPDCDHERALMIPRREPTRWEIASSEEILGDIARHLDEARVCRCPIHDETNEQILRNWDDRNRS